jgi:hypothetical protein
MSPKHGNCAKYVVLGQKKIPRLNEAQGMPIRQSWPILPLLGQGNQGSQGSQDGQFHIQGPGAPIPSGSMDSIQIEQ